jgi:nucleotide-binding universal stress UspA family protein
MTRHGKPSRVVVGVDEARSAEDAVDWATAEAAARGCPLRVVHAFRPPLPADASGFASPIDSFVTAHTAAQLILGDAVTRARSVAPGIEVSTRLVRGTAARALLGEARDARLLVLGSRGRSGLRAVLSGSAAAPVSRHPLPDRRHPPFRQPGRRPGLPAVGPPCHRRCRPRRIPLRRDRFRLPRRISTGHTAHRPVGMDTGHSSRHRADPPGRRILRPGPPSRATVRLGQSNGPARRGLPGRHRRS